MLGKLRQAGAAPVWARGLGALLAALLLFAAAPAASADLDAYAQDANTIVGNVDAFDGPQFAAPADGRIRGYGFSFTVTKSGPVERYHLGSSWYHAGQGQRLVGFNLRIDDPADSDHPVHGAVVVAGGGRIAIGDSAFDLQRGEWAYVASVPAGTEDVGLELSAAGYAQTFSLTTRARTGPQPTVLYRDPLSPHVAKDNAGERTLRVTDDATGDKGQLTFSLVSARLSFFTPPEPVGPAEDAARAFLVIEADVESPSSSETEFRPYRPLPASALTATLPDGTVVQAQHAEREDDGFMPGSYYFPVPGDTEAARVTIRPGTFDAYRYGEAGAERSPVKADGAAVFDVEFTPGAAARLPKLPKGATATTAQQVEGGREPAGSSEEPASNEHGEGAPWLALVVLLGLAAAAGGLLLRRRIPANAPAPAAEPDATAPAATLTLPAPFVTLAGPGAADAARAAIAEAMADDRTTVVVLDAGPVEQVLDGMDVKGLRMVGNRNALALDVEAACLATARAAHDPSGNGSSPRPRILAVAPGGAADVVPDERLRAGVDLRVLAVGGAVEPVVTVEADGTATLPDSTRGRLPMAAATQGPLPDAEEDWVGGDAAPESEPVDEGVPEPAHDEPDHIESASSEGNGGGTFVELLGPCRIAVGGKQIKSGLRHKARELLVLLAVRPDGVTQDVAIEALWPDVEREKASEYLRQAVKNLRKVFRPLEGPDGGVIDRDGPRYQLTGRLRHVDVREFEDAVRAAESGDAEAARRAIALYRGELAAGYDYPWIEPDREHLRLLLFNTISRRVEACREAGDLEGAAAALSRGISVDRFSEPLYRDLMAVQRAQGREDAVRRTYARVEAALAEIGMKPEPRTTALLDGGAPGFS